MLAAQVLRPRRVQQRASMAALYTTKSSSRAATWKWYLPFGSWLLTHEDIIAAEALEKNPSFGDFKDRAGAVRAKLEAAEDVDALRAANKQLARNDELGARLADSMPAAILVAEQWQDQVL
jgi:hypothetical protein